MSCSLSLIIPASDLPDPRLHSSLQVIASQDPLLSAHTADLETSSLQNLTMASFNEKHVSFNEPLLIQVVEVDPENVELPVDQKRTRNRKLALWVLAIVFVGLLVAGPAGTFNSTKR